MEIKEVKLTDIQVNQDNPRTLSDENRDMLLESLLTFPKMLYVRPIVVDDTNTILGGNMRHTVLCLIKGMTDEAITAALAEYPSYQKKTAEDKQSLLDYWREWRKHPCVPVAQASTFTEEEKKHFVIADNLGYGNWDIQKLIESWDAEELLSWGLDLEKEWFLSDDTEPTDADKGETQPVDKSALSEKFVVPPLSILDARQGYWSDRKKIWRSLIGDYGESREDVGGYALEYQYQRIYKESREERKKLGISFAEYLDKYVSEDDKEAERQNIANKTASLFDPVLAEVLCKWFTPGSGDKIFDCFSGDTQKGLVFGYCGREFTGIELRKAQVDVNNKVLSRHALPVRYICDDGRNVAKYFEAESQDMLFSCPPYYDLEVYSDDERDASNQATYSEFVDILAQAYKKAYQCLRNNRFIVIVVGDVRDDNGVYRNICGDIKRIFMECGAHLYNELIYVEPVGTGALRAEITMTTRKVVKTHQNVLVFYKGNPNNIKEYFPKIEYTEDILNSLNGKENEE